MRPPVMLFLCIASVVSAHIAPAIPLPGPHSLATIAPPKEQISLEPRAVAGITTGAFMLAGVALGCAPQTLAGLMTGAIVTAPVNILDIAIMENASGKRKLGPALTHGIQRLSSDPVGFAKSPESSLVYTLFACTYATANICKHIKLPTVPFLIATTAANMGSCFYKDSELARLCGTTVVTSAEKKEFPLLSYACLAARDTLAMGSSFTLPPILGKVMAGFGAPSAFANNFAQLFTPVAAQTVQVPFHLMALSLYNQPQLSMPERVTSLKALYTETLWARMARVLPCYGAGGVINNSLKARLAGASLAAAAK